MTPLHSKWISPGFSRKWTGNRIRLCFKLLQRRSFLVQPRQSVTQIRRDCEFSNLMSHCQKGHPQIAQKLVLVNLWPLNSCLSVKSKTLFPKWRIVSIQNFFSRNKTFWFIFLFIFFFFHSLYFVLQLLRHSWVTRPPLNQPISEQNSKQKDQFRLKKILALYLNFLSPKFNYLKWTTYQNVSLISTI